MQSSAQPEAGAGGGTATPENLTQAAQTPDGGDSPDLVYVDELTGIYNRRYYNARIPQELEKCKQNGGLLSLAVVDVDYFKSINDSYGHHQGDRILSEVGAQLNAACKTWNAIPIRWGGDEFIVLLPGIKRTDTLPFLQYVSKTINALTFDMGGGQQVSVTLSIGVAGFPDDVKDASKIFDAADSAVYVSKREGRNRISTPTAGAPLAFTKDSFHRLFPCPKLVGRQDIVGQIRPHLVLKAAGQERPLIMLEGQNGVGKSRLLETIQSLTDAQRSVIIPCRGQPYLMNQPYGALLESLRYMTRFDARLAHRMAASLTPREIRAIYPLLPDVAGLSMFAAEGADGSSGEAEETPRKVASTALVKILIAVADGKPLTIFVDDMQWCEQGTMEVLETLKNSSEGRTALIVGALRKTGEVVGEGHKAALDFIVAANKRRQLLPIEVEQLSYHSVREMIGAILPGLEKDNRLVDMVKIKSQALPLLVEEILKYLIQQEYIFCKDGKIEVADFSDESIPAKVSEILELRSQALDIDIRGMVSKAAVAGASFDIQTLKELEGTNEGELLGALDKAAKASFLQADSADEFRFTSDDAQEVMYEQVDPKSRTDLHAKLAEMEERKLGDRVDGGMGKLAFHHERAGNIEKAMSLLSRMEHYDQQPIGLGAAPTMVAGFVQSISEDIAVLVKDLESGNPAKITAAYNGIITKKDAAVEPLFGLLASTNDLRARNVALECLKRVGVGILQRLVEELHKTQDYAEKCRYIATLGCYRDPRIASELESFIRFPEQTVRREALRVLEALNGKEVRQMIRSAINDKNDAVAQDAIASLGRIADADVVSDLVNLIKPRTFFFFELHKDKQRQACMALGLIKDKRAHRPLLDALRRPPFWIFWLRTKDPQIRAAAAYALTSYPDPLTEKALERAMRDKEMVVKSAAKISLNKLRGKNLQDPKPPEGSDSDADIKKILNP